LQKFIKNYIDWHQSEYTHNANYYEELASNPIQPEALIISCCDGRILANHIFNARIGELFIHRTIANLVPPFGELDRHLATASAIEFSVNNLKIRDIIILGHSACAGIAALQNIDHLGDENQYLASWLSQDECLVSLSKEGHSCEALEKKSILNSISNLEKYPIIREAKNRSAIEIHGLWLDIGPGIVEMHDKELGDFVPLIASERNQND